MVANGNAEVKEDKPQQTAKSKAEYARPRQYGVYLLNDDFTPMDFVVEVLKRVFFFSEERAVQVMLDVHKKGKGNCGIFTRDVAESKVALVMGLANEAMYPLRCDMEAV